MSLDELQRDLKGSVKVAHLAGKSQDWRPFACGGCPIAGEIGFKRKLAPTAPSYYLGWLWLDVVLLGLVADETILS